MIDFLRPLLASSFIAVLSLPGLALAQDASMKVCGEKWQAAKAAGTTGGTTWPKFLADCRATASSTPTAPAAPAKVAAPPAPASETMAKGKLVFPSAVPAKFADLTPARARQKACSEQYQANKATDSNGGLRWLEKGGGYWSQCNRKLKG